MHPLGVCAGSALRNDAIDKDYFFFPPLKILTDLWPWREGAELLAGHGTRDL